MDKYPIKAEKLNPKRFKLSPPKVIGERIRRLQAEDLVYKSQNFCREVLYSPHYTTDEKIKVAVPHSIAAMKKDINVNVTNNGLFAQQCEDRLRQIIDLEDENGTK